MNLKKLAAISALATFSVSALAVDWVCSTSAAFRVAIAAAEQDVQTSAAAVGGSGSAALTRKAAANLKQIRKIDRTDLVQAYRGQPVLLGHTWLLAVMLPADHPTTRQAFADLGISPEAAERLANGSGLIDRGIRVVQTESQMLDKISLNPPAVGYVGFFTGSKDAALCF